MGNGANTRSVVRGSAQGATNFCAAHGGGTRCFLCKLVSVPRLGFLCWTCRVGAERLKQFEHAVEVFLQRREDLRVYTYRDQTLPCAPTRRRPDFTYTLYGRIVVLEVDEHCRRYCQQDCECIRVLELREQGQGKALFLIRFNPLQRLLGQLADTLRSCFTAPLPETLLHIRFLGYNSEYSVVEVTRIARNRTKTEQVAKRARRWC